MGMARYPPTGCRIRVPGYRYPLGRSHSNMELVLRRDAAADAGELQHALAGIRDPGLWALIESEPSIFTYLAAGDWPWAADVVALREVDSELLQ